MNEPSSNASAQSVTVTARAGTYYRVTRYLMTVMFIAMGLWFGYDGFVNWPRQNADAVARDPGAKHPHTDLDITIQKILACVLPPAGIAMLIWTLYKSRGKYELTADNTLHVPGHPPIPLDNIRRIDKKLWDRKGIISIDYEDPTNQLTRTFVLDDFVYERDGTDEIFKRIEAYVLPAQTPTDSTPTQETNSSESSPA
jgi:hypothetical protein